MTELKGRSSLCKYWHTCSQKTKTSWFDAVVWQQNCPVVTLVMTPFRVCLALSHLKGREGFTSGWSGSIFQFHSCELLVLLYLLNSQCSDCVLAGPSRNCDSIPGRSKIYFFSSKHRERPVVSHCLSEWAPETLTPGDKVAEGWSHTSTHPRAFMVWYVV